MTRFTAAPVAAAILTLTLLTACTVESSTVPRPQSAISSQDVASLATSTSGSADVARELAALRRAVEPLQRFDAASQAGWSAKITSCMADPAMGGMGFHYGNVGEIDGSLHPDRPELLLFEPEADGSLRFVAVEFVVPYTFHARAAEPPVMFGRRFARNDRFQLWGLHVWVGRPNPSGLFASWNPRVDCEHTTDLDSAPMTH